MNLKQGLLFIAVVLLVLAAWPAVNSKVGLGWLGLACFVVTWLV